jgi:hypothetical protein
MVVALLFYHCQMPSRNFGTSSNVKTNFQDIRTDDLSGTMNITFSPAATLVVLVMKSDLSSESTPTNNSSLWTFNVGFSFRGASGFCLYPSLSYSRSTPKSTGEATQTFNSFAKGEIVFVPKVLSLVFSGAFSKSKMPPAYSSDFFDVNGGLNVSLAKLLKIEAVVLSLKSGYRNSKTAGVNHSDYRIWVEGNFSF